MCNTTRHIIKWLCLSALLVSCGKEMDTPDTPDVPTGEEMTLHIGFKVPTRAAEDPRYEDGATEENYIDIAGGNYRIYFFDEQDKFIARFEPSGFISTEGSDYCQYSVLGKAPDALVKYSDFKMVVLANWPHYPEDLDKESNENLSLKKGETTIADICNADWAQYSCLTDEKGVTSIALNPFVANPNERKLMPFYGVHEYKGVTFTSGIATILDEPVTLLRAMAKVEVILEIEDKEFADDLSFSSLKINRYNAKGYCAPKDVFLQDDYVHKGDDKWENDYVRTLHLVNDKNDEVEKELVFRHVKQWNEGEKLCDKWVAYLPEYQNIGVDDAYSSIKAKFNIQLASDTPHTIYFANYNGGKADNSNGNRLNIERNNIYRFHVKCTSYNYSLLLTVSDWEGLYENIFDFGETQIVSPVSPWDDEKDNEVIF